MAFGNGILMFWQCGPAKPRVTERPRVEPLRVFLARVRRRGGVLFRLEYEISRAFSEHYTENHPLSLYPIPLYCHITTSRQRLKKLGLYDAANYCKCLCTQHIEKWDVVA